MALSQKAQDALADRGKRNTEKLNTPIPYSPMTSPPMAPGANVVIPGATPSKLGFTGVTPGGGVSINMPVVNPPTGTTTAPPPATYTGERYDINGTQMGSGFNGTYYKTQAEAAAAKAAQDAANKPGGATTPLTPGNVVEGGYQNIVDAAGNPIFGGKINIPATEKAMMDQHFQEQERQKQYLASQSAKANQVQSSELEMAKAAAGSQKAAIDANYAVGREGVMSSSKPMAGMDYKSIISQGMTNAQTRYDSAVAERDNMAANLSYAQQSNNYELATQYAGKLANAELKIQQSQDSLMRTAIAMKDSDRQEKASNITNLNTFSELVKDGQVFDTKGLMSISKASGLPFESIFDYYQGTTALQQNAKIDTATKKAEQGLKDEKLRRERAGILGADAEKYEYYKQQIRAGADPVATRRALGISDTQDPEYKLKVAEGALKQLEIDNYGKPTAYGTEKYWDMKKAELEFKEAKYNYDDTYGGGSNASFDGWVGTFSAPDKITQDWDVPASYIEGRDIHGGIDIAGAPNSPVPSPVSGKVVEVTKASGKKEGWGNSVVIDAGNGRLMRIAHFNATNMKVGDQVESGQIVGTLGNTGYVKGETGNHVHMEVKENGKLIDPRTMFGKGEQTNDVSYILTQVPEKFLGAAGERAKKKQEATRLMNQYGNKDVVVDIMSGFAIDDSNDMPFATGLSMSAGVYRAGEKGDMSNLAKLINGGLYGNAISMVENGAMKTISADREYKDTVAPKVLVADILKAKALIELHGADIMGKWDSKKNEFDAVFPWGASTEEQKASKELAAALTGLNIEKRHDISGTAVTKSEGDYLKGTLPEMSDQPSSAIQKLDVLADRILSKYNISRDEAGLPPIKPGDYHMLESPAYRVGLYEETGKRVRNKKGGGQQQGSYTSLFNQSQSEEKAQADSSDWL